MLQISCEAKSSHLSVAHTCPTTGYCGGGNKLVGPLGLFLPAQGRGVPPPHPPSYHLLHNNISTTATG
jgi:hypothetical protein